MKFYINMIIYYKISAHVGVCHLKVFHLHHTIQKAYMVEKIHILKTSMPKSRNIDRAWTSIKDTLLW
jgi:hypothetical protein